METLNSFMDPAFKPDDAESRCETNQRLVATRSQAFTFGFAFMPGV